MESHSAVEAGAQWCDRNSLQPGTPGLKLSPHLSLLKHWEYRHEPLCLTLKIMILEAFCDPRENERLFPATLGSEQRVKDEKRRKPTSVSRRIKPPKGGSLEAKRLENQKEGGRGENDASDGLSLCCPGWNAVAQSPLTATSTSRVQAILCLSLP
ncbi:Histone demethylase UTY, partial [Plecturocebus cupreus]